MSPLFELARFGQSYWLDDLTRPMIESGELQRRVTSEGLTGVTANPAIFRACQRRLRSAEEAVQVMRDLKRAGIDVPQVTRELLDEGISSFIDALNDILQTIGTRAITSLHGEPTISTQCSSADTLQQPVTSSPMRTGERHAQQHQET